MWTKFLTMIHENQSAVSVKHNLITQSTLTECPCARHWGSVQVHHCTCHMEGNFNCCYSFVDRLKINSSYTDPDSLSS